jgi:hypothetical protein
MAREMKEPISTVGQIEKKTQRRAMTLRLWGNPLGWSVTLHYFLLHIELSIVLKQHGGLGTTEQPSRKMAAIPIEVHSS